MSRFTKILILILISVSLACGVLPLPKRDPARFDYHSVLTPLALVTPAPTVTPLATREGDKPQEWTP